MVTDIWSLDLGINSRRETFRLKLQEKSTSPNFTRNGSKICKTYLEVIRHDTWTCLRQTLWDSMELTIEQALQLGIAAHKKGNLQEAERLYRVILQSQPDHPDANHNLGVLAAESTKLMWHYHYLKLPWSQLKDRTVLQLHWRTHQRTPVWECEASPQASKSRVWVEKFSC